MSYINSKEYWDHRFETNWVEFGGRSQTNDFMKLLINELPESVNLSGMTILDWGCALGDGVDVLAKEYPSSEVSGLDFSEVAIKKALETFPMNDFYCGKLQDFGLKYQVIITSNCLGHFEDPLELLKSLMDFTTKHVIILVPHNDDSYLNKNSEHKSKFTTDTFPDSFCGFRKSFQKVIDDCGSCWAGEQILVVYSKV